MRLRQLHFYIFIPIAVMLHYFLTLATLHHYMKVAIPSVDEMGTGRSSGHNGEDILTRMRDRSLRDLAYLINKPPRWNEQVCDSYTVLHSPVR